MSRRLYFDHNASTPIAPEVREAMEPFLTEAQGNPSSAHWAGRPAREAVEDARARVAAFLNAEPDEIVLTSGGSEANNTAIKGAWFAAGRPRGAVAITAVEHPATVEPARFLERLGARVVVLPVDGTGRVDPGSLRPHCGDDLVIVSAMHANNEVGTLQPVAELAALARDAGAASHCDAAQSAGKVPVDVRALGVDFLSLAGHKLHAPKGVGALFIRRGAACEPLVHGAGHEGGRRAGTESALLAAALGAACDLAARRLDDAARVSGLRDGLWRRLTAALGEDVVLLGHPALRLPNTLCVGFVGCLGDEVLARCPGLAASTGAACHGGGRTVSATLAAMGVAPPAAHGAVRLSLGHDTTEDETAAAARLLTDAVRELRGAARAEGD